MTKVKMCGLSRMEDIEYANEVLPEFIGFVFAPKSRRYVSFEQAKKLRGELDYRIAAVGVFVDEDIENIVRRARCFPMLTLFFWIREWARARLSTGRLLSR